MHLIRLAEDNVYMVLMLDFLMRFQGQMLPQQMVYYFELITKVSYREGFVILLDIWQYFQVQFLFLFLDFSFFLNL